MQLSPRAISALWELRQRRIANLVIKDEAFTKQAAFIDDSSNFISTCCSRRSGKTWGLAAKLINTALKLPNTQSVYIGLTRSSCHRIMVPILKEIDEKNGIFGEFKESKMEYQFLNGSKILLFGADSKGLAERLRGAKYPKAVIDEAQSYRIDLEWLISDILTPAVAEYNGSVEVTGTPGPVPSGFFYDSINNNKKGFKKHHWTVFDNPHFPSAREFLEKLLAIRNLNLDSPSIQREWFGQWVQDEEALVYKFNRSKNLVTAHEGTYFVLGVDLGYDPDPSAFVLIRYDQVNQKATVISSYKEYKMTVTKVAAHIKIYVKDYPGLRVVADLGALGKMIGEEIRKRYGINLVAADKRGKAEFIELLNDDFKHQRLQLTEKNNEDLINELLVLQWDISSLEKKEDASQPNHCTDAMLYGWRYCYHYIAKRKDEPLTEEDKIIAELEKKELALQNELKRMEGGYE